MLTTEIPETSYQKQTLSNNNRDTTQPNRMEKKLFHKKNLFRDYKENYVGKENSFAFTQDPELENNQSRKWGKKTY